MSTCFLRVKEVVRRTGLSQMSIWRYRKAGRFPAPVRLGPNSTAYVEDEIEAWCAARVAERDGDVASPSPQTLPKQR